MKRASIGTGRHSGLSPPCCFRVPIRSEFTSLNVFVNVTQVWELESESGPEVLISDLLRQLKHHVSSAKKIRLSSAYLILPLRIAQPGCANPQLFSLPILVPWYCVCRKKPGTVNILLAEQECLPCNWDTKLKSTIWVTDYDGQSSDS